LSTLLSFLLLLLLFLLGFAVLFAPAVVSILYWFVAILILDKYPCVATGLTEYLAMFNHAVNSFF
jgi:uncharacterized protein YqgC (DUF456 family)